MHQNNKSAIKTPIIGRVIRLNKALVKYGRTIPHKTKKSVIPGEMTLDIRKYYFYPLLEKGGKLFEYAMNQLKGRDYLKRSLDIVMEIQARCYLIMELHGWSEQTCAELDLLCDDIIKQLYAISNTKGQIH